MRKTIEAVLALFLIIVFLGMGVAAVYTVLDYLVTAFTPIK